MANNLLKSTQTEHAPTWLAQAHAGYVPTDVEALQLAEYSDIDALVSVAGAIRDQGFGNVVTYSRKVFIPLTH